MNRKPLSNLAKIISGGTPKRSIHEYWNGSIPWISVKDLHQGKHIYKTERFITESGLKNSSTNLLIQDDIVISARGTVGLVSMITEPMAFNQSIFGLRSGEEITAEYLYYWLKLNVSYIQNNVHGSVFDTITRDTFDIIEVTYPSLEEQKKVTEILRLLDEKIEQNHQINDNLLDLSMTHFERWLETTSSTNNVSLDEIATYKNGLAMQKFEPENDADSLPVLKIRELNQGFTDSSSNRARTDIDKSVKVYDGDVIFSWSGTLLVDIWTGGPAGLNQHLFKVTSDAYPKWFYYMWTRYHLRQFQQIAAGKATTMGHIKRGDLKAADVIIPTDSEFVQLETLLKPVVDAYIENGVEIKSLQTIRDQLLQKLLG